MGMVVMRIQSERQMRMDTRGLADLIYADDGALAPLKAEKLLYGPFTHLIPTGKGGEGAATLPFAPAGADAVIAIPYNARNKEGAIVLADILNSPAAREKYRK
jgi:ABC-type uncharacterized transport system YnjBCD substrate-binding protein